MSTSHSITRVSPRIRIGPRTMLTAIGALLTIAAAVTILALTNTNQAALTTSVPPAQSGGPSGPEQSARQMAAFEASGYVPVSCTIRGTLMRNYHNGRSVVLGL